MNQLTLHPNIYKTGHNKGLISLLERLWVRDHTVGQGTFYIVSGLPTITAGFVSTIPSEATSTKAARLSLSWAAAPRNASRAVRLWPSFFLPGPKFTS